MDRFNIKHLNNIKNRINEETGVTLPKTKSSVGIRVTGIIIAIVLVLTPITAYGHEYMLDAFKRQETEKELKTETSKFISEFFDNVYGISKTYVDSDGSGSSLHDLIRQAVFCFKGEASDFSRWSKASYVINPGIVKYNENFWYIAADVDISELVNQGDVRKEYYVRFYLKYEDLETGLNLTDMYFVSTLDVSETVFGDIGVVNNALDMEHFVAWADSNDDFRSYINRSAEHTEVIVEKYLAEETVFMFMENYMSFVYGHDDPWVDKEGQIYTLLGTIEDYIKLISPSIEGFTSHRQDFVPMYDVFQVVKIGEYWYGAGAAYGSFVFSGSERISDFFGEFYLKFKNFGEDFELEDFFLAGPSARSRYFFGSDCDEAISGFRNMEDFVEWADFTNDYSDYIYNGYKEINRFISEDFFKIASVDFTENFLKASFSEGEKDWSKGKNKSLNEFIDVVADYLKLTSDNGSSYTTEVSHSSITMASGAWYSSVRADIKERKADNTEITYITKFFFRYGLDGATPVIEDFYFYGNLPQCAEIFERYGKNTFSLTNKSFKEWAANHDDYSAYTQKVHAAIARIRTNE